MCMIALTSGINFSNMLALGFEWILRWLAPMSEEGSQATHDLLKLSIM